MADDLETSMRQTLGAEPTEDVVAAMRERIAAQVRATTPADDLMDREVHEVGFRPEAKESSMKTKGLVAGVAAAIAIVVGLVALNSAGDDGQEAVENPTDSTTAGADASAGCGLDENAAISATVDDSGESVRFDITFDPACAGVEVTVSATPTERGLPIERPVTLDGTGEATLTDQLLGSRAGAQDWAVELVVSETGGIAATSAFTVLGVCDLDNADADLQATYLPESNEVEVVFIIDPICAGTRFAFDGGELFASSPAGGWNSYVVDDAGRIEITEELKPDVGPIIGLVAQQAPEVRGILTGAVARATLDIGS